MRQLLLVCATLAACGDNNHEAPDAAPVDAPPPFVEATHADVPQVASAGGAVVAAPKVVPIFFTGDGDAQASLETFLGMLAASRYWVDTTFEYGVGKMTVLPDIVSSDPPPTTDDALQAWIVANAGTAWPAADANTIYTVFLPQGIVLDAGGAKSCKDFGGYHDETVTGSLVYALVPRCPAATSGPLDEVTLAASHELVEASTDPHPGTAPAYVRVDPSHFIWGRTPGGELGDMCEYVQAAGQRLLGDFMVQRTWSNASAAAGHDPCVPAMTGAYVAAAPVFDDLTVMSHGGQITTKGITVNLGTPATFEVDLFSDAPSADFTVQAMDAKAFTGAGTPSFQFQWDQTSGHNGDKLNLTVTRTVAGTGHGGELVVITRMNNVAVSLWWGYVAGQ